MSGKILIDRLLERQFSFIGVFFVVFFATYLFLVAIDFVPEPIAKEIESDLKGDEFTIKEVSMKTPGRKHYWVTKLINHKKRLIDLKAERFTLKKEISKQIIQQSPVKITMPVAEKTAYQHERMIELQSRIDEQELAVEFLEKVEKTFSALSFDIKNIVEIMKMETL